MATITPKQAQDFVHRWKLVEKMQTEQLRRTSMTVKLRQLSALFDSGHLFGQDSEREREVDAVRERWTRLREKLRG